MEQTSTQEDYSPIQLRVWYEPAPIPWTKTGPGHRPSAHVTLSVYCVDSVTNQSINAIISSTDEVNDFTISANNPQRVFLHQVPTREGPPGHSIVYETPLAQVSAPGYPDVTLSLD